MNLPKSTDEDFIMTIKLLANTLQAAYQIKPEFSVANAIIIVRLCLNHGLTKESVIGFTVFGVIFQGAILGNHKLGFDYSKLSFEMLKSLRIPHNMQRSSLYAVILQHHGKNHLWKQKLYGRNAYKNGLEIGDWFHAGCAAAGVVQSMFMRGVSFEDIFKQIEYYEKVLRTLEPKNSMALY